MIPLSDVIWWIINEILIYEYLYTYFNIKEELL